MYEVDAIFIFRKTSEQMHASKDILIPAIENESIKDIPFNPDLPTTSTSQMLVFEHDFRCTSGHDLCLICMFRHIPDKQNNEKLSSDKAMSSITEDEYNSLKRSNIILAQKLEERDSKIMKIEDSLKIAFEKIDRMLAARNLAQKAARKHGQPFRNILK